MLAKDREVLPSGVTRIANKRPLKAGLISYFFLVEADFTLAAAFLAAALPAGVYG